MATGPLAPVVHFLRKVTNPAAIGELPDAELLVRFARQRDETAFTALVRRHGPMVLAVCRRVVRDGHAAEDAFQATFLVLARKAASLTQPELLGNWLYGVAYRTAMKARRDAARRHVYESQAGRVQETNPNEGIVEQELRAILDEEINRLPQRYRVPVVLCYLQGQTNAEAARVLGCSRGTVATLLARARDKLRRRLTQRGIGLSVGVALGALPTVVRGETVALALVNVTVNAATLLSAGQVQAAGVLAARAVALAKGVSKTMLIEKLKIPAAVLVMTALVGAGAGVSVYCAGAPESAQVAKRRPQSKAEEREPLEDKRRDKPLRPQEAAPAAPEGEHIVPLAKHSFREELPDGSRRAMPVLVVLGKDGMLTMWNKIGYYHPVTEEVTLKSGRKTFVTTYEEGGHTNCVFSCPIDKARVYDTKGRKIDAKELRKRLKGETLALVVMDDPPPNPLHLRIYKEDTLVFPIGRPGSPVVPPPAVGVPASPPGAPPVVAPVPLIGVPPATLPEPTVPTPPGAVPPPPVVKPEEITPPSES